MQTDSKLLVTGATGHLGRRVVHHLLNTLEVPPARVIATTRKPDAAADLAKLGIEVRAADFDADGATLAAALRGATRMLLVSTDRLDVPGLRLAQHQRAIAAAVAAGVQHVVYTSMPSPETSRVSFAPEHAGTERALAESALPGWTVLRNSWYFENWFHSIPGALKSGQWYSAAGDGKLANIARDDLARAAATVLAGADNGAKRTYTLSGAELLTTREIAATISAATGKPLAVVDVPIEGLVQGMVAHGFPEPIARIFASFDANTAAGGFASVSGDYRTITGREPQRLADWCAANVAGLTGA
ncbi:MAG TPA: NmrA family NAD(P)-binding protein [Burkholderiaceae bacterium]